MAGRNLFEGEPVTQPVEGRDLFAPTPQTQAQPAGIQPVNIGNLAEQYSTGVMTPDKRPMFEELVSRGKVPGWAKAFQPTGDTSTSTLGGSETVKPTGEMGADLSPRKLAMLMEAESMGVGESFLVGTGKGFTTVGRGLGLVEPAGVLEKEAMEALNTVSPVATGAGEIVGEAAPFVPLAMATGGISSLAGRAIGTGLVGAAEGGIIQAGKDEDVLQGALLGGGIGLSAEILLPVVGRLGRKVFQRVMGKSPRGALIDAAGQPTKEMVDALDMAGMSFNDLTEDAQVLLSKQKAGAVPGQAATAARAAEEGIPLTKGEVTKDYRQQATENRLLESAEDTAAEPLRQYKLKQSEAIKENLRANFGMDVDTEETGQLIQDALTGRKKLLRTQKNELYESAAQKAEDIGGIPILTDSILDAMPDTKTMRRISRIQGSQVEGVKDLLTEFGMVTDDATVEAFTKSGGEVTPLTISNFEDFRAALNQLERSDTSGATSVITGPIKDALDGELNEVDNIMAGIQTNPVKDVSYRGTHQAPGVEDGAPAHALAGDIYPDDIYSDKAAQYYGTGDGSLDRRTVSILQNLKGWPEKKVKIYRAVPKDAPEDIAAGDWITVNKKYAEIHGEGPMQGDYKIIEDSVEAQDIFTNGDSIHEFGYSPKAEAVKEFSKEDLESIKDIRDTLKGARKTVRQLKTEFSPKSIIGKVVDLKKDGVTPITEASKVYNKLVANSAPVEEMRRVVKSLRKSGDKGEQALASLQSATMMDLIDAGFGTESRKISGVKTFNPIAFKRRLEKIGQPKLKAMFANNKQVLKKLNNIDAIASDLIPPSGAQPKGSASVILDLANTLGLATIMAKIPGGALLAGSMKKIAQPVKTGIEVGKAMKPDPDVVKFKSMIEQQFPGLASAIGTVGALEANRGDK